MKQATFWMMFSAVAVVYSYWEGNLFNTAIISGCFVSNCYGYHRASKKSLP